MTAFTTLLNALFLPGKPILGSTGSALRDNLLSALEGDPTAPRVQTAAMINYITEVTHTNTTQAVLDLDYPAVYLRIDTFIGKISNASGSNFRMRASSNGGTTWGAYTTIAGLGADNSAIAGTLFINISTGVFRFIGTKMVGSAFGDVFRATGTIAVAAGTNALSFSFDNTNGTPNGYHLAAYMGHGA